MAERHDMAGGETGSRLVYGIVRGRRRSALAHAASVGVARRVDALMAGLGLARPVLLVSGFWRSGTTWVQEIMADALEAKTVFEPLSPQEPARRAMLAAIMPAGDEDRTQATIPGRCDDPAFWRFLDRAATGRHTSPFLLSCRATTGDSWRRRIVVKDVRLQANLAAFHHRFAVPVLHVRRHPCAVVASLLAANWHWSFARVRLGDLLPAFGGDAPASALASFDTDAPSRIAALWAVTERLAEAALAGQRWGRLIAYEALVDDPAAAVAAACAALDLTPVKPIDAARPSASVDPQVFAGYGAAPRARWRDQLAPETIDRIHAVVDTLHPAWRRGMEQGSCRADDRHVRESCGGEASMAIKFTDKDEPAKAKQDAARAVGEARFATPVEADAPVNPDAGSELPFTELPKAEKNEKKKRPGKR